MKRGHQCWLMSTFSNLLKLICRNFQPLLHNIMYKKAEKEWRKVEFNISPSEIRSHLSSTRPTLAPLWGQLGWDCWIFKAVHAQALPTATMPSWAGTEGKLKVNFQLNSYWRAKGKEWPWAEEQWHHSSMAAPWPQCLSSTHKVE